MTDGILRMAEVPHVDKKPFQANREPSEVGRRPCRDDRNFRPIEGLLSLKEEQFRPIEFRLGRQMVL